MSTSSDRPTARAATASPYATLTETRTQTGMRRKEPEVPATQTAEESTAVVEEAQLTSASIPPDALRKPYASLPPQKRNEDGAPAASEATSAGVGAGGPRSRRSDGTPERAAPRGGVTGASDARRWADTTEAKRRLGSCAKHGIARAPSGECLLCKKEQTSSGSSLVIRASAFLLLGCAAVAGWLYLF